MATYKNEINNQIVTTVQISGDAKIAELESALERSEQRVSQLNTELQESAVRVSELATRLHEVESASGITAMREELERFQQTAANSAREFEAFLQTTRLIGVGDYAGFSDRFSHMYDQVSDGAKTAQQAISEVKREYSALIAENVGSAGGVFDAQSAQQLSATLMKISESIDIVLNKVNEIQSEGVRVSGEMGEISSSGASVASVLDKISAAAAGMDGDLKGSYDAITQLTQAMIGYSNVDGEKLLQISNTFRNIGTIGNGKFSDKAMANIVRTVGELQTLSAGGQSIKIDVSGIEALSGLKVSKAALVNLKEYLPQIAAVNTSGLKKLAGINFDNLNNLKVSKASVSNLADLANISKTLEELKTRVDAVAPSMQQLSSAEKAEASTSVATAASKQKTAEAYKNAGNAIKEYYSVFTTLAKTKGADADIKYSNGSYASKSGHYATLAAELNRVTVERQRLTGEEAKALMTEEQAVSVAEQESAAHRNYALVLENIANKEREATAAAAAKEQNAAAAAAAKEREVAANKAESAAKKQAAADTKLLANVEKDYNSVLDKATSSLSSWTAAQHSSKAGSREAYESLKSSVSEMNAAAAAFNGDKSVQNATRLNSAIEKVKSSLQDTKRVLTENGDATKSFADRVGGLASKFTAWLSASQLVMYAFNGLRQMVQNVVELDTAMTELKKVTDETDAVYERFLSNASSRARDLGATISDTVTATADFARLGYNIDDASALADTAIVYKNVGDGIENISDASESIISTMQAFGIAAEDSMSIVDKFNEVGNSYAISSKGVGEALMRSASAMHAAGNSLDETIALATAANTVIQNPESVGTTLKTISMFLRAAKTEAQEAGEDTEGMADSVSKLRGEILALTGNKVDIQIDENNFKNTTQILRELSAVWGDLSDITRANILEKIGGKRNANVTSALIENFDLVDKVIKTSQGAEGSALAENDKYLESIEGHIAKFKASFQELSSAVVDPDLVKTIIDIGNAFITVAAKAIEAIDAIGGWKIILGYFAGNIIQSRITSIASAFSNIKNVFSGIAGLATPLKGIFQLFASGQGSLESLKYFLSAEQLGGLQGVAAVAGIMLLVKGVQALNEALRPAEEKIADLNKEFESMHSSVESQTSDIKEYTATAESTISKYAELAGGVNKLGENVSLTDAEYEEYLNTTSSIAEMFPQLSAGFDENGNAILSLSNNAEVATETLNALLEAERQAKFAEIADKFPDMVDNTVDVDEQYKNQIKAAERQKDVLGQVYQMIQNNIQNADDNGSLRLMAASEEFRDAYKMLGATFDDSGDGLTINTNNIREKYDAALSAMDKSVADVEQRIKTRWASLNSVISAWMETDYNFGGYENNVQTAVQSLVAGIDFSKLDITSSDDITDYITNNILNPLTNAGPEVQQALVDLMSFAPGDMSFDTYKAAIEEQISNIAEGMDIDASSLMDWSGYGEIFEGYEDNIESLSNKLGVAEGKIKSSFSPDEIKEAFDLVKNYGISSWDELISALENNTISDVIDFEKEKAGIESYNAAISASASETGLASDAVEALSNRYSSLEQFNPEAFFEDTANGVHVNRTALKELEEQYESTNKAALDNKLDSLADQYQNLTDKINSASDESERANLYVQRDNVLAQIEDTKNLIAQYNALTSAYSKWKQAQGETDERSMYEDVASEYEKIGDLISRGWYNDAEVDSYLDMMLGTDRVEDNIAAYEQLTKTIEGTSHSMMDFYTFDGSGNSTSAGLFNFLDAVREKFGETYSKVESDGTYWFDFTGGKLEEVASAFGMTTEQVQILERAMIDAGFDVKFDSAFSNIDDIIAGADSAVSRLQELKDSGAFETDFKIDFKSRDVDDIESQISSIEDVLKELGGGEIDLDVEGADDAAEILTTLVVRKNELENETIMKIDLDEDELDTDIGQAISKIQAFVDQYSILEAQQKLNLDTTEAENNLNAMLQEMAGNKIITGELQIDTTSYNTAMSSLQNVTPKMLVTAGLDSSKVDGYKPNDITKKVIYTKDSTAISTYEATLKTPITKTVYYNHVNKDGPGKVDGTAHVRGTAYANGSAYAQGYWGTKDDGIALGGELGQELVVRDGRFFTIGDDSAELFSYKKGDIIFNAAQTEEIFSKGKIRHGNGRGRALVTGTAFDSGSGGRPPKNYSSSSHISKSTNTVSSSTAKSSSKKSSDSKSNEESEFEKMYKYHQHLLKMEQEDEAAYIEWLDVAYKEAYKKQEIELDDYYKY